jgi:tetratricopeptide (TPR) repeat protein
MNLKSCLNGLPVFAWAILALIQIGFASSAYSQEQVSIPAFSEHIAPILYKNCVVCHRAQGVGPFSLVTYEEVSRRARQIAEVVESRYMPPWQPERGHGPKIIGERSLTDEQIALILAWGKAGSPSGNLQSAPLPPPFSGSWTLGEPDLILELPESYLLPADGEDIYRSFVIPLPFTEAKWIRALEFHPETSLVIHHAVMQTDSSNWARKRDEEDAELGFDGMDLRNIAFPQGKTIGWAPGQMPFESFPETAWELPQGADLVLQLHLLPSGKSEMVNPKIGLYFSDTPPERETLTVPMREIDLDIPPGEEDYTVSESITFPVATKIVAVAPHAHYLAKAFRIYATLPNGEKEWLLHIPDWDFNWQSDYRFVEPFGLPANSTLVMEISYDNSVNNIRNPNNPPRRVKLGPRSSDEMGESTFELLVENESDLNRVKEAVRDYQARLLGGKDEFFFTLGLNLENLGRHSEAMTAYRLALDVNPENAKVLNNIGALFNQQGDEEMAKAYFQEALEADGKLTVALSNVARILVKEGNLTEALEVYRKLTRQVPEELNAWLSMAAIEIDRGQFQEAINILSSASIWHSEDPRLNRELGKLYSTINDNVSGQLYLEKALNSDINHDFSLGDKAEAYFELAEILRSRGKLEEAAVNAQLSLEHSSAEDRPRLLLAALYLSLGQMDQSRQQIKLLLDNASISGLSVEDIAANLPYPEGVLALSELLRSRGEASSARGLINKAYDFARTNNAQSILPLLKAELLLLGQ